VVQRIVVVGASLAGLRAVETLRARGFGGTLTLIGEEPHRPYDRPPLSKQVLQGTWAPEQTFFRKKEGYEALSLDMRLGVRATGLDVRAGRVSLADGSAVEYDRLIIATGARVRTPPNVAPRPGLHVLRGLDDVIALREALARATHLAIVGAGFIGLEVAASCRARGLAVTVVESRDVPLSPALGPTVCGMVAALHRDHGVDLRTSVGVTDVLGDRHVEGLTLSDGSRVEADVVVVGIGVVPNTDWLEGSGLTLDNGIVCNGFAEAAPGVYAAGDVARVANQWTGDAPRIEHWTNAVEQGVHAAENALAGPDAATSFSSVPYVWSDQYDRKIQFLGRVHPHDEMRIVEGSLADRRFTALYRLGDRLVGCLALNEPRAVIKYRRQLQAGVAWKAALSGSAPPGAPSTDRS
jgi:NADPH-dependent 2,4-dienoyl-CoA reductase/sulfur reductase-like enzyme